MTPSHNTRPNQAPRTGSSASCLHGAFSLEAVLSGAFLSLALLISGCTKTSAPPLDEPMGPASKPVPAAPSVPAPQEPIRLTPAEENDLTKIREWSQSQYVFTEADRDSLRDFGPIPAPGSTKEAYLVLGFVRVVLARGAGPSLENYAREYRIPMVDSLKFNTYLKGVEPAKRVIESLQKIPVSEAFFNQVTASLRAQGATWDKGGPTVDSILPPPPGSLAVPFAATSDGPQIPGSAAPVSDRGLLELAQQLADSGLFVEAIMKVQLVADQSPLKILAIQKSKEYSQNGIQDLRRKARTAFQSASVAADDRSRTEYLKTARVLLEDALILYPDAPQVPIVKENLKAISLQIKQSPAR